MTCKIEGIGEFETLAEAVAAAESRKMSCVDIIVTGKDGKTDYVTAEECRTGELEYSWWSVLVRKRYGDWDGSGTEYNTYDEAEEEASSCVNEFGANNVCICHVSGTLTETFDTEDCVYVYDEYRNEFLPAYAGDVFCGN